MADLQHHRSTLEEIDDRQDDVLLQLDQLNGRIETLLKAIMATRDPNEPLIDEPVAALEG